MWARAWARWLTTPGILGHVGYNPYRKFKAKPSDYVFLACGFAATIALIAWGFFS